MVFRKSILTRILLFTSLMQITACSSLGYLAHTSSGHLKMMSQRQSIEAVIEDNDTKETEKASLKEVLLIRNFASQALLLPDNKSYTSYVDIKRDYVTWVVFAAQPLSLEAKTWCFWVVGCVPYRGYFDRQKALNFALQLERQGYETYVASVPAYSTLGWFSDPVLSSMLNRGNTVMAEYIFHELAHQKLYIKNDTSFNEAFATAIGQLGVEHWLRSQNKRAALSRYLESNQNKLVIYRQIAILSDALRKIYQSDLSDEAKIKQKAIVLAGYKNNMSKMLKAWNKLEQYQAWLLSDINNAKLNAFSTYRDLVPLFERLFDRCDEDFASFYKTVESMSQLSKQQRLVQLQKIQCDDHSAL